MKRETVLRMLKKRLALSKRLLKTADEYNELTNVLGGVYNKRKEEQFKINMQTDIEELEICINSLKNNKSKN